MSSLTDIHNTIDRFDIEHLKPSNNPTISEMQHLISEVETLNIEAQNFYEMDMKTAENRFQEQSEATNKAPAFFS